MRRSRARRGASFLCLGMLASVAITAHAKLDLRKVNHVIILMQENHSFDTYFGVLPYVPAGPYHPGPCTSSDHACVDGLTCALAGSGRSCTNSNADDDASTVLSFHSMNYCPGPDLRHDWPASHQEVNFLNPASALLASPMDGFVLVNDGAGVSVPDGTGQPDVNGESPTEDDTMGHYDQTDLPFYYGLAQTFAIDDRYFSSVVDPAFGSNALGTNPTLFENDEHPPTDIRAGQFFVSQIVNAFRASACWGDSILFITYDEHGGFYDHVAPPKARQGGLPNPDGISPGH